MGPGGLLLQPLLHLYLGLDLEGRTEGALLDPDPDLGLEGSGEDLAVAGPLLDPDQGLDPDPGLVVLSPPLPALQPAAVASWRPCLPVSSMGRSLPRDQSLLGGKCRGAEAVLGWARPPRSSSRGSSSSSRIPPSARRGSWQPPQVGIVRGRGRGDYGGGSVATMVCS